MIFKLDNSAFSLLSCQRRFQLRVIEGRSSGRGDAASFGDAVHKMLEFLDKGDSVDTMIEKIHKLKLATDIPKALSLVTFFRMSRRLPAPLKLLDGSLAVELKFSHKYASLLLPSSHELLDIYLEGTIDRIDIEDDVLVIRDYKTTQAATPYKISDVLSSYALSFQLPFYLYALRHFGILPASYQEYITARKYRMEILLLAGNTSPPTFKTYLRHAFNDDFIDREVPLIINSKIQEAVNIASLTTPAPHTGMTVYKACDNCEFRPACLVMGEAREDEILSRYDPVPYNPLSFR